MGKQRLGILGKLSRKARGFADLLTALVPLLPRSLGSKIRRTTRGVRRSDRKVRRVNKALGRIR